MWHSLKAVYCRMYFPFADDGNVQFRGFSSFASMNGEVRYISRWASGAMFYFFVQCTHIFVEWSLAGNWLLRFFIEFTLRKWYSIYKSQFLIKWKEIKFKTQKRIKILKTNIFRYIIFQPELSPSLVAPLHKYLTNVHKMFFF